MSNLKIRNIILIVFGVPIVAVLGSIFVNLGMDWFDSLIKPSQWIPNYVIPIVWTVIYLSFIIVLIVWQTKKDIPTSTKVLLIINGILNVLWCLVFFALRQTFLGNIVIIINLIMGILLLINIYGNNKIYSYILSIYPVWLSIATTLNLAMWILN